MLRWKNDGNLNLSPMVGQRFSTNGDYAGFIDYRRQPNDLNFNPAPFPIYTTRGPINTSHLEFLFKDGNIFVNFEDASIPPMLAPFVRTALDAVADAGKREPLLNILSGFWKLQFQDLSESPDPRHADQYMTEHEMLQNTFFFNVMGRDRGTGVFSLDGRNNLTLDFPDGPIAEDPVYARIEEIIGALNQKMGGEYFRFPFWGKGRILNNDPHPDRKFVTVHPLGGCIMGADSNQGVVSTKGEVFDPSGGPGAIHVGLYIADASVIPGPVAANPTLTIVAMAKKIVANIP
jgi:cholesterol oxidase